MLYKYVYDLVMADYTASGCTRKVTIVIVTYIVVIVVVGHIVAHFWGT